MQITQNNNSPQFKGSFLINYKKAIPGTREAFEKVMGAHKGLIYENFNNKENQVMYVLKNSKDFDVANFIQKNEMNFRYYPDVTTKQRFELDNPDGVVAYIKNTKAKLIHRHNELKEYVAKYRENCRQVQDSHLSTYDKILRTLKYDMSAGKKTKDSRSITTFVDMESGNKVVMSPQNAHGVFFVMVNPKNDYDSIKRYAFDAKGNLLTSFQPPNGIRLFDKKFKEAIVYQCSDKK